MVNEKRREARESYIIFVLFFLVVSSLYLILL